MKKPNPTKPGNAQSGDSNPEPEGYPHYPTSEDIYSQYVEEQDIDPEDPTRKKANDARDYVEEDREKDLVDLEGDELLTEQMGKDLDIPGAELDDDNEAIGNEDEENNYYSIGGDNHNNLEEDQGEEWP
jgi:hypothetical protein